MTPDQRGSMMPLVGAIAVAAIVSVLLAVEIGMLGAAWRGAAVAADAGALAGASMLDRAAAYGGELRLDVSASSTRAVGEALATGPRPGRTVTTEATPGRICVTVRQPHHAQLLGPLGIAPSVIEVTGCAEPRQG